MPFQVVDEVPIPEQTDRGRRRASYRMFRRFGSLRTYPPASLYGFEKIRQPTVNVTAPSSSTLRKGIDGMKPLAGMRSALRTAAR